VNSPARAACPFPLPAACTAARPLARAGGGPLARGGRQAQQVDHRLDALDPLDAPLDGVDLLLAVRRAAQIDDPVDGVDADLPLGDARVAEELRLDPAGDQLIALGHVVGPAAGERAGRADDALPL